MDDEVIARLWLVLGWCEATALYATGATEVSPGKARADMKRHNAWLRQRLAACSVSGKANVVQFLREVLLRGLDILDGKAVA